MDFHKPQHYFISNSINTHHDSVSETTSIRSNNTKLMMEEKKNIFLQALEHKKNGRLRDYYTLIEKQSFKSAKEEPVALRIWVKVFLDSMSLIIHEYKDYELLELLLFKLPWFSSLSTHGRHFRYFCNLAFAVFPHDPSYLNKVISHVFSPFGLFECIMNGEMRSSISEILWVRALQIIQGRSDFSEEEIQNLHLNYKSLTTAEDILNRAKVILKSYSDQDQVSHPITKQLKKVMQKEHQIFLKALFSFSQTRDLNSSYDYPIFVGAFQEVPGFYVLDQALSENSIPSQDDFVSLKKSLYGLNQEYVKNIQQFVQQKFENSAMKHMGSFLVKLMKTYPFTQQVIFKSLTERIPHKNSPVENQLLYNQLLFQILKDFPKKEKTFLSAIVEKLSHLDIEIKLKSRRCSRSHFQVQEIESYLKELKVRVQDEKQVKFSLLFDQLLNFFNQKIQYLAASNDNYEEELLSLFKKKIFSIQKLNFLQYLPLYIMTLKNPKNQVAELFCKKLLSFFILQSFSSQSEESLLIRQHSWNYLVSFLSRQNAIIDQEFFTKCISLLWTKIGERPEGDADQIFDHCIIQGLALLIANKGEEIKRILPEMYEQMLEMIFKRKFNSLQYCSTYILWDLIRISSSESLPELGKMGEKLVKMTKMQKEMMATTKKQVYGKVQKFLPYEVPFVLLIVQDRFQGLTQHDIGEGYVEVKSGEDNVMEDLSAKNPQKKKPRDLENIGHFEEIKVPKEDAILYSPRKQFEFLSQKHLKNGYNSSDEMLMSFGLASYKQQKSHSSNHSEISNEETQHSVDNQFSQTFDKMRFSPLKKRSPNKNRPNLKEQTQKVRNLNEQLNPKPSTL